VRAASPISLLSRLGRKRERPARARGVQLWTLETELTLETEWKRVVTKLHRSAPRGTGACTARGGDASLEFEVLVLEPG